MTLKSRFYTRLIATIFLTAFAMANRSKEEKKAEKHGYLGLDVEVKGVDPKDMTLVISGLDSYSKKIIPKDFKISAREADYGFRIIKDSEKNPTKEPDSILFNQIKKSDHLKINIMDSELNKAKGLPEVDVITLIED